MYRLYMKFLSMHHGHYLITMISRILFFIFFCKTSYLDAIFIGSIPNIPVVPAITNLVFRNQCLEDLGCFFTGPPFYHPVHRPISVSPYILHNMDTKFLLFTPSSKKNGKMISPNDESLSESSFDPSLPVKCFIHGYMEKLDHETAEGHAYQLKDALLEDGPCNVILVDWAASNRGTYPQAVANTRVVGAQLANLILFLQREKGINPMDVHLIGFSLGAHVAGYAGERIRGLGRITGLDPAGPFYYYTENEVRLDKTDAEFVDIIHTDLGNSVAEGLGISEVVGDQDFYPNGGAFQPGCDSPLLNPSLAAQMILRGEAWQDFFRICCDHIRAVSLFTATINSTMPKFMAKQCDSFAQFRTGECLNHTSIPMGFYAQKEQWIPPGFAYFVDTGRSYPYCLLE